MNEFEKQLAKLLTRQDPRERVKVYRNKVKALDSIPHLKPERAKQIREFVTEHLDTIESVMQRDDYNGDWVNLELEEVRNALRNAAIEPSALRGAKQLKGATKGHEAVHGSKEERKQRRSEYQAEVNRVYAKNPALSWNRIQQIVGEKFNVSYKTIQRNCKIRNKVRTLLATVH